MNTGRLIMAMPTHSISMNESNNNKSTESATEILFKFFSISNVNTVFLVKLERRTAGFPIHLYYFGNSPTAIYTNIVLRNVAD